MRRWLLPLLLSLLALAGQAEARSKRDKLLDAALAEYAATLRWGNFEGGASSIDPAVLEAKPLSSLDIERYRQVRVSYYHAQDPVAISKTEVRQVVEIGIINAHSQSERVVIDRQVWRYDEKAKRWWLMSGLPDITRKEP